MANNISSRLKSMDPLFLVTVAIPTIVAILYYGLIASDIYVSQSSFVVRSPDKQAVPTLGMLLKGGSFGNSGEDIDAVIGYAQSRDALTALNQGDRVRQAYGNPNVDVFDRFGGFGFSHSFESLYKYFGHKVRIEHDSASDTTKLTVRAFTANDAYQINEQLLNLSEGLVNQLNERGQQDLIRFAQREVSEAETKDREAAQALSAYRNKKSLVDPQKQADINLQLISKLQDELITTKTQLSSLKSLTPQNPQIGALSQRVASLQQEIDAQTATVAGGSGSLAGSEVEYQRLVLESQFADKQLASTMTSLEEARNDARRKQVYLERIVQPNRPDKAIEPTRAQDIFATFILGLVAWGILTMLLAGLREHQD